MTFVHDNRVPKLRAAFSNEIALSNTINRGKNMIVTLQLRTIC